MKMYSIVKYSLLSVALLGLAACSTTRTKGMEGSKMAAGSQAAGTKAYGYNQGGSYATAQTAGYVPGMKMNSLRAPSNQTYYFAFDKSRVKSRDLKAIAAQARYLSTHPSAKIRLAGNTDNRGSREYNIGLGWRRDQAVTRIFEQEGVSPKQIVMVSYGKERPAVLGNNPRAWALNRRVNLAYVSK